MSASNNFIKRQKEQKRKEKQAEKDARKAARKAAGPESELAYLATGEAAGPGTGADAEGADKKG